MSYAPSTLADCPDIQAELVNYFQTCSSANLREPMPFFDFLFSDMNQMGYSQIVAPGGGKLRNIVLRYDQRILESAFTAPDGTIQACTSVTKRGDLTHTCTIDPVTDTIQFDEVMTAADFMNACRSNDMIVAGKIQRLIDALVRKVASKLTLEAVALLGQWNADTTPIVIEVGHQFLEINTYQPGTMNTTRVPNALAWADVDFAIQQTLWCGNPTIFGGSEFYKYAMATMAGCCSQQGVDSSEAMRLYGKQVSYDSKVQNAIGKDKAWVIQPGSLAPVYWNLNDNGIAAAAGVQEGANYRKLIIQDPASGLPIDLTISDNCGSVSIIVRATTKLCGMPIDIFAPGDPMEGVTGFAGIKVTNT